MLFTKRVTIFKRKNRAEWLRIKEALSSAGLMGVKACSYESDSLDLEEHYNYAH